MGLTVAALQWFVGNVVLQAIRAFEVGTNNNNGSCTD